MKRLSLLLFGFFVLTLSAGAYAADPFFEFAPGYTMTITDAYGSRDAVSSFSLHEDVYPWIYLTTANTFTDVFATVWADPDGVLKQTSFDVVAGENEYWFALGDVAMTAGQWQVQAGLYNGADGYIGAGDVFFTVTAPEPLSALLFLLGGTGMAVVRFRKRSV